MIGVALEDMVLGDLAFYLALGAALGAGYFALLRRAVRLYAGRGTAQGTALGTAEGTVEGTAVRFLAFYVLRFAGAGLVFYLVVQQGALPLLMALLGFLLARIVAQRVARGG